MAGWTLAMELYHAGDECDDPDSPMFYVGRGGNILADLIERVGVDDVDNHDEAFKAACVTDKATYEITGRDAPGMCFRAAKVHHEETGDRGEMLTWLRRGAKDYFQERGFWSYATGDIEQRKRCLRRLVEVLEEEGTPEVLTEVAELRERAAGIAKDEEELRSAALKEARDDMLAWAEAVGATLYAPTLCARGSPEVMWCVFCVSSFLEDGEASRPACGVRGLQGGQGEGQGQSQGQGQGRGQEAQGRQATGGGGGGGGGSLRGDAAAERRQGRRGPERGGGPGGGGRGGRSDPR
jgi:hypothetical protein